MLRLEIEALISRTAGIRGEPPSPSAKHRNPGRSCEVHPRTDPPEAGKRRSHSPPDFRGILVPGSILRSLGARTHNLLHTDRLAAPAPDPNPGIGTVGSSEHKCIVH